MSHGLTRRRLLLGGASAACALPLAAAGRAFAGTTGKVDAAGHRVLTATDVHVSDYPTVEAVRWIGQTLERETGGRLTLRLYHSGQLGREAEAIDMARYGVIDITRVFSGALNNAFPLTQALCLPYVFDSIGHMRRVIDGDVGEEVLRSFETRDLVGLAIYDSGARCFYNTRRPIVEPKDLHGMKMRVAASDIFIKLVRLLGANPTPMSLGETFSAMETHMIDGAENNMRSFHSSRHFEAAGFWSETRHSYAPDVLVMSRASFVSLSPADRELLVRTARESVPVMRAKWDESEGVARAAVLEHGIQANEVDMPAFHKAAQPLLDEYHRKPEIEALYRRIRDLA
ncbi:TRAP transporter substrate-binding protein [Pseudoxanthomonas koreensis]|uniref:TRAP transporter substrate-binding protein n=1 Tax=Pseudoxanthomonas koreensis TaxID=266061 RepID=UPI00139173F4|nr:TRAP transporter substrate-binding protein [Pseudoxanthomonas koreensis]KAF1691269.1 C4-dicarboxylate ABC transporter [Pseudoxanthomonas koreensis]